MKKRVTGLKSCSICHGKGKIVKITEPFNPKPPDCKKCKGSGKQKLGRLVIKQCAICYGNGFTESYYIRYLCSICEGTGEIKGYKVE